MSKLKHPQQIADMAKKHNEKERDAVFDQAIEVFGKDVLFVHDCIKQIMTEHYLDRESANLQAAFVRLAIGIKRMNYPKSQHQPLLEALVNLTASVEQMSLGFHVKGLKEAQTAINNSKTK